MWSPHCGGCVSRRLKEILGGKRGGEDTFSPALPEGTSQMHIRALIQGIVDCPASHCYLYFCGDNEKFSDTEGNIRAMGTL